MTGAGAELGGWGRYPRIATRLLHAANPAEAAAAVRAEPSLIARGNGRAYGDAAVNPSATLSLLPAAGVTAFDTATGRITCAAGTMLGDVIDHVLPHGWFVPVTPGTRFVTIGGMLAADVHGKNHHCAGSFGDHVDSAGMVLADGSAIRCGPGENADLFAATRGGMGLTGVITDVAFRLIPVETNRIRQSTRRARNLADAMAGFEIAQAATYAVAWIDCLASGDSTGRSVLFFGEHATATECPNPSRSPIVRRIRRVPFDAPGFALNRLSVAAFNALYYRRNGPGERLVDYDTYFYPLDGLLEWNRIYGRSGFVQFQCVLPKPASAAGLAALLDRIAAAGAPSFLAVLKLLGKQDGLLSFPMEGYTLALDFRATPDNLALLRELDAIVADHAGRLYLAKDAVGTPALLRSGYPRLDEFQAIRRRYDPDGRFTSALARRLGL